MKNFISALGCGVNEYHDIKYCRYGRILICTDGDCDGLHIAALMLGMIGKKMTFLLRHRRVALVMSPIYRQNNKYYYLDSPMDDLDFNKPMERFKGLGELSLEQAKETLCDDATRRLVYITEDNLDLALRLLTSASARKELMMDKSILIDKYNTGIV